MGAEEVIAIGDSRRLSSTYLAVDRCAGGRRLMVGMKLNTSCREMLTWTIAKLAQPGDHILALHVSSQLGATVEEEYCHEQQLANTLRGVLSVYESLCNLKQIKLQLEIVSGYKVKNVLVEVASSYDACKLILGTNKSFSVGRTRALGRYCLNRLPCTCTVIILDQGEIIFDKKGRLGTDMTRLDMIKVFRRSMRLGRHRTSRNSQVEEEPETKNNKNISHNHRRSISDIPDPATIISSTTPPDLSFGSCSSLILREESFSQSSVGTLPRTSTTSATSFEALRVSFSKRRAQGGLKAAAAAATIAAGPRPDMNLLDYSKEKDHSNSNSITGSRDSSSPESYNENRGLNRGTNEVSKVEEEEDDDEDVLVPGWPLLHHTIGFEKHGEEKFGRLAVLEHDPSPSPKECLIREEAVVGETTTTTKSRVRDAGRSLDLAQDVAGLCSNRACTAFRYEELEAATCGFSQENVVGQGGGSEVFHGTMRDGRVVAVKRLNPGPQAEEELLIDIEINTTLAHTHVVSLLGYCVEASHLLLVYDYLPEGNLEDHLHAPGKGAAVLPWDVRYKVAVGVARALEYLHKGCPKPVVHRDVKTSNILLTANFESQLSDFGLAMWAPNKASHLLCNDVVGTFGYLAPEYFMFGRVNDKTDVYAFGVVLLELITGRKPIDTTRPKGEENLVNWARPLLLERALNRLVDPSLGGVYNTAQMNNMVVAAFHSIQQSAQQRPQMSQILQILSVDHGTIQSMCTSKLDVMTTSDPEEEADTQYCGGDDAHIRSHLALAMMGVDDDSTSQCSVVDLPHSNKYLEEYLEGRFSRSASFED